MDWIKIDVEGAEYETLCGLGETISRYHPRIIMEVETPNLEKVIRFMETQRYKIIKIASSYFMGIPTKED